MPRIDRTKGHRLDMLVKDGAALDQIGTRLAGLIDFIRHAAKDVHGEQTGDALNELAEALVATASDHWGAAVAMHDADCDLESVEQIYVPDDDLTVALGVAQKEPAKPLVAMAAE